MLFCKRTLPAYASWKSKQRGGGDGLSYCKTLQGKIRSVNVLQEVKGLRKASSEAELQKCRKIFGRRICLDWNLGMNDGAERPQRTQ